MQRTTLATLGAAALMSLGLLGGSAALAQQAGGCRQCGRTPGVPVGEGIAVRRHRGRRKSDRRQGDGCQLRDRGERSRLYEVEILKADGSQVYANVDPADGSVQISGKADDSDEPNGDMDDDNGAGETDN